MRCETGLKDQLQVDWGDLRQGRNPFGGVHRDTRLPARCSYVEFLAAKTPEMLKRAT